MKPSIAALVASIAILGVAMAMPAAQDAVVPEEALVASNDPSACKTDGEPCSFPYTWGGRQYTKCIADDWYRPWCGTGSNPWTDYAHCLDGCETTPEKTEDDDEPAEATPPTPTTASTTAPVVDEPATGPEPDGATAPVPPAEPEDPDCEKACCTIDLYKKPQDKKPTKPNRGRRRKSYDNKISKWNDKVDKWEADKWPDKWHMKKIEVCSYTGEHPFVAYTDKVKSFKLSGDCEKVTLFDDDPKKREKHQNNDVTYTSSQDSIDKDLRNDIEGVELFITNKNTGACNMPGGSNARGTA